MKVKAVPTEPEFRPVTLTVELETPVEVEAFLKLCGNPNAALCGLSDRGVFRPYQDSHGRLLSSTLHSILAAVSISLKAINKEDF